MLYGCLITEIHTVVIYIQDGVWSTTSFSLVSHAGGMSIGPQYLGVQ